MASAEPGLDERIFGGRWAVAERSPKPAWVQIEEQLADRIESGAARRRRAAPARARPRGGAVGEPDDGAPGARLARRARAGRARRRPRHVRARDRQGRARPHARRRLHRSRSSARASQAGAQILEAIECPAPDRGRRGARPRARRAGRAAGARAARRRPADDAGGHAGCPPSTSPACSTRDLTGSLYALMRERYELGPVSATERLEPVAARSYEAEHARRRGGLAADARRAGRVRRRRHAVEFARDRHRGDAARFVIRVVPDELLARAR